MEPGKSIHKAGGRWSPSEPQAGLQLGDGKLRRFLPVTAFLSYKVSKPSGSKVSTPCSRRFTTGNLAINILLQERTKMVVERPRAEKFL